MFLLINCLTCLLYIFSLHLLIAYFHAFLMCEWFRIIISNGEREREFHFLCFRSDSLFSKLFSSPSCCMLRTCSYCKMTSDPAASWPKWAGTDDVGIFLEAFPALGFPALTSLLYARNKYINISHKFKQNVITRLLVLYWKVRKPMTTSAFQCTF